MENESTGNEIQVKKPKKKKKKHGFRSRQEETRIESLTIVALGLLRELGHVDMALPLLLRRHWRDPSNPKVTLPFEMEEEKNER